MSEAWIEIIPNTPGGIQGNDWQALFAIQVGVRPFSEWVDFKWGFNAGALVDEFLDRQKLFIESQHSIDAPRLRERQDQRSLALRLVNIPGEGLQVGLTGRLCAASQDQAENLARGALRELTSVLPYDYKLLPACSRAQFLRISALELLAMDENSNITEIRRGSAQLPSQQGFQLVPGLWQSGIHAHEQIWRALAAMERPALLNINLQPTLMYENEQRILWSIRKNLPDQHSGQAGFSALEAYAAWGEAYVKRRLAPWRKFFYLQVHLAQAGVFDEGLARCIGAALTRSAGELVTPGYQLLRPASSQEEASWRSRLSQGQFIPSPDRLEQLADLDEAFAVLRLPHHAPPLGLPGVNFICRPEL